MKYFYPKQFLVSILFLGIILNMNTSFAQCSGSDIISQNSYNTYLTDFDAQNGQTFLATCDGRIESITVNFGAVITPGYGYMDVYDYHGTKILGAKGFNISSSGQTKITFNNPISVIAGQQYMYLIDAPGVEVRKRVQTTNPYADGTNVIRSTDGNYNDDAYGANVDFWFKVDYSNDLAPLANCQDYTAFLTGDTVNVSGSNLDNGSSDSDGTIASFKIGESGGLETTYASNEYARGIYFDVVAKEDIVVTSLDISQFAGTTNDFFVYYKVGSYVGSESDPSAWTLLSVVDNVTSAGDNVPTRLNFTRGLKISKNQTVSIYFHQRGAQNVRLTYETYPSNTLFASDDNLEIYVGACTIILFGTTTYVDTLFNGKVNYTSYNDYLTYTTNYSDIGEHDVSMIAVDNDNNYSVCESTVTVVQKTFPPDANCQDTTVTAPAMVSPDDIDAGSTDSNGTIVNKYIGYNDKLETPYTAVVGGRGIAFDVSATQDLFITSFDVNVDIGTPHGNLYVYYKDGTHVGFEEDESAWTFNSVIDMNGSTNGMPNPLNLNTGIPINAGQTKAFMLFFEESSNGKMAFLSGTSVGNTYLSDSNLTIYEGTGLRNGFDLPISPGSKRFQGTILYTTRETALNFDCATSGTYDVSLVVEDNDGNYGSCSSTVTVNPSAPLSITCPGDITQECDNTVVTYSISTTGCVPASTLSGFSPLGEYNGNTYYLSDTSFTPDTAFTDALAQGGYVATIKDMAANDFLETALSGQRAWLGLNDVATEGTFVWQNGSPVTFTNWGTGQPNNGGSGEDYVLMREDGTWHDYPTTDSYPYILMLTGGLEQTAGLPSGSDFPFGTTTNTFLVTDSSGNTATCSFDVLIEDNEAPTAICKNIAITLDALGTATIVPADVDNGSNDTCGSLQYSVTPNSFDCSNVGDNTVALTVTDLGGNTATCNATVTVIDPTPPVASCVSSYSASLDATGTAIVTVADIDNGSSDNCGTLTSFLEGAAQQATTSLAGNIGAKGFMFEMEAVNDIIINSFDVNLDSGLTHDFTIYTKAGSYIGSERTPADWTIIGAASGIISNGNNTATPLNLDMNFLLQAGVKRSFYITISSAAGNFDLNGIVGTAEGSEYKNDGNLIVYEGASKFTPFAVVTERPRIFSGNVHYALAETQLAYACENVGNTQATLVVADNSGNSSSCTATVTVVDTELPTAVCQNITVQLDANGSATITPADVDGGSTDNCGIVSTTIDVSTFDCSNVGANNVVLTVTDTNGNVSTCTATVTVEDNIAPTAVCQNITVQLDANGTATIIPANVDGGSTDNCAIASTSIDISTFDCSNVGANNVVLTVTDTNGNVSTCTAVVTVEDNVAPMAVCQNITVQLDANGTATITPADVDGGSTDACGIASTTIDITDFDCSNIGPNTITLTVTDENGNISTCTTIVTVEDNVPPVANCATPFTIQLDANGMAIITVADIENGSTDACGITSTTIDITDFDCSDVGPNTVTLTVTDVNGNTSTCTTIVTVEDNVAPVANCATPFTIQLDANGMASITVADIENGSTDACGIASTTIDITDFDCSDVGPNTVTLTVTDNNGNTSTCSTIVTVEDNIAPTIVCPANIMANTDPGDCFATVNFGNPLAFDNCSVDTLVQTAGLPSGSQFPVGESTVEFTATDPSGNTSMCSFTITVTDNELPIAVCQNITIQLDEMGNAVIVAADVDGGSTDQCGVAGISIDRDTFDCSNVGDNNVILSVIDVNGNNSNCTAIVTVEDVTAPLVACQNITVELEPTTGTVTIDGTDIDNGSTDACGIASYDLDMDTFDCSNVGDNSVVLTVTDVNGNTATCMAIVTVEDNSSPILVCQDFTLELGADGTAILDPSDVIASNNDACGILTTAIDITDFSCADIGAPVTVQVFSQDNNGNLATCMAEVTIVDLLAPEITCPDDQIVDPGAGNLFYILPDYFEIGEASAIDNCTDPIVVTAQDPAPGTPLPDGTYTITMSATDSYGNVGSCNFQLTVDTVLGTGANVQNLGTVQMYPSPAKTMVIIGNPQNLDLEKADIYDLTGRLIQSFNLKGMKTSKTLNVDNLAAAAYVVIIKGKEGQITKRLIKE